MKIGKVEIPQKLETIIQKNIDQGIRFIDISDASVWDYAMTANEFREGLTSMFPHDSGRYEAIYQMHSYILCELADIPEADIDDLSEDLSELDIVAACPAGKEDEYEQDSESMILIFLSDPQSQPIVIDNVTAGLLG